MISLLVDVVGAEGPVSVEGVLDSDAGVNGVRSLVIGIDDVADSACGGAGDAAGIAGIDAYAGSRIHRLQSSHPAVLREIVVVETEAGANHRGSGLSRRIGNADARGPKALR